VYFYTVQIGDRPMSEFDDFQQRMSTLENRKELAEINKYIANIGDIYGAITNHFRKEDDAEALPPTYHYFETEGVNDYGIRLYCIRLTPSIVILLNGDRKTALKVKDCKKCKKHFEIAVTISKKITQAKLDDFIDFDDKDILMNDDFELTI
jgi:hypothetical protein